MQIDYERFFFEESQPKIDLHGQTAKVNTAVRRQFGFPMNKMTGTIATEITDIQKIALLLKPVPGKSLTHKVHFLLDANQNLRNRIKQSQVNQKKLLEETALAEKELKNASEINELKSKFVTLASHEFRTPLSTVLSSVSLIKSYSSDIEQPKREKHASRIKNTVNNLEGILEDFLSLSKLEEGKIKNKPTLFDFEDFLTSEINEKLNTILKNDQLLHTWHEGDTKLFLDKSLLRNILFNLVSNSVKYSDENTVIMIVSKNIGAEIEISIIDKGIGIPKEEIPHIFKRFHRAHNVEHLNGTGLGLNIVQRYIDLMGGKIIVSSILNQGTTMRLLFPILSTDVKEQT